MYPESVYHVRINNVERFGAPIRLSKQPSTRDHAGVAGGCTRRISEKFEVGSPQQVACAGRETSTSRPPGQGPILLRFYRLSQPQAGGCVLGRRVCIKYSTCVSSVYLKYVSSVY